MSKQFLLKLTGHEILSLCVIIFSFYRIRNNKTNCAPHSQRKIRNRNNRLTSTLHAALRYNIPFPLKVELLLFFQLGEMPIHTHTNKGSEGAH